MEAGAERGKSWDFMRIGRELFHRSFLITSQEIITGLQITHLLSRLKSRLSIEGNRIVGTWFLRGRKVSS